MPQFLQAAADDRHQRPGQASTLIVRHDSHPVHAADGRVAARPIVEPRRRRADGLAMLAALSGRTHRVMTAVALASRSACEVRVVISEVTFRTIDEAEAERYWDSEEPADKAGGYAIQGWGAVFVSQLHGSYSAVVGLPLCETAQLIDAFGLPRWTKGSS